MTRAKAKMAAGGAPEKLDAKDRRILLELDRNCRQRLTELATRLRMPIETVRYRIDRLANSGIIKNFLTVIDGGRLGFYYYKVFLRLHNVNENNVQKIVSDLCGNPRICWVVRIDGSFDIGFTPRVSNPVEQSNLMDEVRGRYSSAIHAWTLSVNVKMDFLARDYLVGAQRRESVLGSYSAQKEPYALDSLDEQVLHALSATPRASGADIAKHIGVSTETALNRIRRLEREKVVVRYMTVVDNERLGQINYYVLVYLSSMTAERERQFVRFCASQPNIVYLIKSLGPWDYELNIEVGSVRQYRELMMRMTRDFADIIREYNGMVVAEVCKYVYP